MSIPEMQMQRNQALACLIMAACITCAVFLSIFGKREKLAFEVSRNAVLLHETLLRQSAATLRQNQTALTAVQDALEKIKRAQ
jgi:hypothetical protein